MTVADTFHGKKPTDREIAVALISEARNALLPARYRLTQLAARERAPEIVVAMTAIQRVLDLATECAEHLNRGE